MWAMTKRVVPPIVLLAAGVGMLFYGVLCHRVSVVQDKEVTVKVAVRQPFMPGMPFEEPFPEDEAGPPDEPSPSETPGAEESPFETPAAKEEKSPFETPDAEREEEEESPFETPAPEEEESPFEAPPAEEPSLMERFAPDGEPGPEGPPFGDPGPLFPPDPFGGPPQFVEHTVTERVIHEESEPALVREVSISGVVRLANGELKRTYSGKPPDFCKT